MRERIVFDFLPDQRRKPDPVEQRVPDDEGNAQPERNFEPTRDGWRAYQAWCKQVREQWKGDK